LLLAAHGCRLHFLVLLLLRCLFYCYLLFTYLPPLLFFIVTLFMDPSKALDSYATRRDLLSGFLLEYTLLLDECPELTDLFSFEAYVQFCFSFFTTNEQRHDNERLRREISLLRDHLPLPIPERLRLD